MDCTVSPLTNTIPSGRARFRVSSSPSSLTRVVVCSSCTWLRTMLRCRSNDRNVPTRLLPSPITSRTFWFSSAKSFPFRGPSIAPPCCGVQGDPLYPVPCVG
eukprot:TRINITY_DN62665_c0_g1_i1.p3 TRINITY_DN62665_c0_g1~~TRINITY_DN62665_c0_g1_i1.p3  ORF type:complete len:116 (-),score=16.02 TRINITY_DN62665_c0_g1_i1:275-580(-)